MTLDEQHALRQPARRKDASKMAADLMDRIVVDPAIMVGKPVVRGTRIPVEIILEKLALELDVEEILLDYPLLTRDDIRACVEYAHALVAGEDVFPQPAEHSESAV